MKLTVLVDNNTLIDRYFTGEPGLSFFIEAGDTRILFDVGYSDAFIKNAELVNIPLFDVDYIVLSHGHLDHTWGLNYLIKKYTDFAFEGFAFKKPVVVTHPLTFESKRMRDLREIGSLIPKEKLGNFFDLRLSSEPHRLTDRLIYLGEIERENDFESQEPLGKIIVDGSEQDDYLVEDSALAYKSPRGLVIITGCSHAGICNIVKQAQKVCGENRIVDIIGGFHLLDASPRQLQGTMDFMKKLKPGEVHACHCTDLAAKIALSGVVPLKEVGVGLHLEYE